MAGAENQISAAKEVENIHKENLDRLTSMSKEEILEEQARLKSSLGVLLCFAINVSVSGKQGWCRDLPLTSEVSGWIPGVSYDHI